MSRERPNVLLVVADHFAAEHLGVAGNTTIRTPGLDELALTGVRYTNAYSECPVCIPARRTLMTGMTPRSHGDRVFNDANPMPDGVTTLAQAFRDADYQADAVGKLHVHPQRDRIGFDSVLLDDESRPQWGVVDDYDTYLGDLGLAGRQNDHGMSNNQYHWRPWHLPEETHATNWAARAMARQIKRRDPTRPAFWYLGLRAPHPPLVPPQSYLDLYRDVEIDPPRRGEWASTDEPPHGMAAAQARMNLYTDEQFIGAKRAFYALCTQIDHQFRYLVGTLRLEGLLDDTIIAFTSDHGDMLGNHGMVAKRLFYESSANIPMILRDIDGSERLPPGTVDDRLAGLQDLMPTLLDLCGIDPPATVDGTSMLAGERRSHLYGEVGEDDTATRMIHDGRHKLVYWGTGNRSQLFDTVDDPGELHDLAELPEHADTLTRLRATLVEELYGSDLDWIRDGELIGRPGRPYRWMPHRSLNSQRGDTWPPSPTVDIAQVEWQLERPDPDVGEDE